MHTRTGFHCEHLRRVYTLRLLLRFSLRSVKKLQVLSVHPAPCSLRTWLAQLSVILPWRRYKSKYHRAGLYISSSPAQNRMEVLTLHNSLQKTDLRELIFLTTVSLFACTSISLYFSIKFLIRRPLFVSVTIFLRFDALEARKSLI